MSTLMEKDVLLERAASCIAFLARHSKNQMVLSPIEHELINLQEWLYSTSAPEIDYQAITDKFINLEHENNIKHHG